MDLATIIGIIGSLGIIVTVMIMDGGSPAELFAHPSAIMLTMGGPIFAVAMQSPLANVTKIPLLFLMAFKGQKFEEKEAIEQLTRMADKARREGLLALEEESRKITDPFLKKGVMMVVDGTDPAQVRQVMDSSIHHMRDRHRANFSLFAAAGGFSPTFGIIGTVMGLIATLKNLNDPEKLAESIAAAFLATLWGLLSANVFFLPIGGKLKVKSEEEAAYRTMLMEGVLAIQAGENPRIIRDKLLTYLPPKVQAQLEDAAGAGQPAGAKA